MRCSCGQPGTIQVPRREMPYCQECFTGMLVSLFRKEVGEGPVYLQQTNDFFTRAVHALALEARRDVVFAESGAQAGCTERAAACALRALFGQAPAVRVLPESITVQELQMFFKEDQPLILDSLTEELIAFDLEYPGTTRSIVKYAQRFTQQKG